MMEKEREGIRGSDTDREIERKREIDGERERQRWGH